ncbi:DUF3427 domain-containing protein [Nonomuraea sp. SYSU D8015]|uniref:DUF3427 domain-containing protein n=1 Tax=Nonomuraea sp. SYSU D8015 TaxID=2593644 RepID=UPI0016611569|nr:DUF3427 domain-containing protein [Nonomuraea sp. SYSU D8015]
MTRDNGPKWKALVERLRQLGDVPLAQFLQDTQLPLEVLYRRREGWTALRRAAGFAAAPPDVELDSQLGRAFGRMLHLDGERLYFLSTLLYGHRPTSTRERRLLAMLDVTLWGGTDSVTGASERLKRLTRDRAVEVRALADVLAPRNPDTWLQLHEDVPVHLHADYTKNEVLAAFGLDKPAFWVAGVRYVPEYRADLFFVTIDKSSKEYSDKTRYADGALDERHFQWESQNTLRTSMPTAIRYIDGSSTVHLFIRHHKRDEGLGAPPYTYAGTMRYLRHERELPIRFVWELQHALPEEILRYALIGG